MYNERSDMECPKEHDALQCMTVYECKHELLTKFPDVNKKTLSAALDLIECDYNDSVDNFKSVFKTA